MAWDASTGATGYKLYYGQASNSYTTNVDVGNQTTYPLTSLQDGNTHFAVTAYNGTTESGFSNEVSATPGPATAPVASFTATPTAGNAPLKVTFTNTSTGNVTSYSWSFADGSSSTLQHPEHTYATTGSYTVSLTVTGPGGSSNPKTQTISVVSAVPAPPVANFSATPTIGTAPLLVNFTNSSTGSVTSYSWDFGDCSTNPNNCTSIATNPAYTYYTAGTYPVSLIATGPGGTNTQTQTGYITVSSVTGGGSSTGLVAAFNFEEASGTTVADASGKDNHGTISGASRITSGQFGRVLSFDGVNDWVTINDAATLDLTNGMTLEAWIYPTVNMTQWATVILKEQPGGGLYELYANGDQSQPLTSVTVAGQYQVLSGGPWLFANQWTHLAATYDGIIERLYVNGTQVAQRPQTGPIQVSSSPLRLGGNSVWGEFFKGRIDEVRIYNRALSATEIQTDKDTSVATSSPPVTLVGTEAVGSVTDSNPQGKAKAFRTTAATTGLVTSLSAYVDSGSTATKLVAALYTDNDGHPGTRLARGTLSSPGSGGWKKVSIPPVSITAGSKYWIALLGPRGVLQFRNAAGGTSQPSETSAKTTLTTLPSIWTSGTVYNSGPLSAYGAGYP